MTPSGSVDVVQLSETQDGSPPLQLYLLLLLLSSNLSFDQLNKFHY